MIFGEILNSIGVLHDVIMEEIGSFMMYAPKTSRMNRVSGIRNICELLQGQFNNNLNGLMPEQEENIDSELEYLFIKLKELEDVVNEQR